MEWKGGVVVTKGGEYAAAALPARTVDTAANSVSISVSVDGAAVPVSAILIDGNYYVSADGLTALLGVTAAESGGVLTVTAQPAASTSGQGG